MIETITQRRIIGETSASMVASYLVKTSARFTCEPQPFDRFAFSVRDDRADVLDAAIETAQAMLATPYLDALAENTEGLTHISPGPASCCHECQSIYDLTENDPAWEELSDEGSFAKTPCDLCGSSLAGDRFVFHATDIHLSGCVDCLHYFANGSAPEG